MRPNDLDALNELLAILAEHPSPENDYVREHLEGVRFYMTGAMPYEMALNLKMAEEAVGALKDHDLKARIERFIEAQSRPV